MKIQEKMKQDWDRRAAVDPYYWVAATQEADYQSYVDSAEKDTKAFLDGLLRWSSFDTFKTQSILDLGCGIGRMTALLCPYFKQVVGVDVSQEMIQKGRTLHPNLDNLQLDVNSGSDLDLYETESFDVVCSYSVLPHLPVDIAQSYFCEIGRILKDQGLFRYQFWVGPSQHPDDHNSLSIHVYDEESLRAMHERAGLEMINQEEIDYFDPILKLKPYWITARRIEKPTPLELSQREVEELSENECRLEYELILYLAVKHLDRNELGEAHQVLSQAITLAPQWPEAYIHKASACIANDDLDGALEVLTQLTQACPSHPQGWLFRAQAAVGEGNYSHAFELLKPLANLSLEPEDQDVYQSLQLEVVSQLSQQEGQTDSSGSPKRDQKRGPTRLKKTRSVSRVQSKSSTRSKKRKRKK